MLLTVGAYMLDDGILQQHQLPRCGAFGAHYFTETVRYIRIEVPVDLLDCLSRVGHRSRLMRGFCRSGTSSCRSWCGLHPRPMHRALSLVVIEPYPDTVTHCVGESFQVQHRH